MMKFKTRHALMLAKVKITREDLIRRFFIFFVGQDLLMQFVFSF